VLELGEKAVFLDRDGVLIEEREYLSNPEEAFLLEGAAAAVRQLSALGLKVVVLTNQSGIGRGYLTVEKYLKVKERVDALLSERGATIDAEYFCPHAPWEGCGCRKPLPGLAHRAERELGITLEGTFVIGDKKSDMEMARSIGARGILVRTGYGAETEKNEIPAWDAVVDGVAEAAEIVSGWVEEAKGAFEAES